MCVSVAQRAQLVHNDADAPDVALFCQHVLVEEFGGGLAGWAFCVAEPFLPGGFVVEEHGVVEGGEFEGFGGRDEDAAGMDIQVHDSLLMDVLQSANHVDHKFPNDLLWNRLEFHFINKQGQLPLDTTVLAQLIYKDEAVLVEEAFFRLKYVLMHQLLPNLNLHQRSLRNRPLTHVQFLIFLTQHSLHFDLFLRHWQE